MNTVTQRIPAGPIDRLPKVRPVPSGGHISQTLGMEMWNGILIPRQILQVRDHHRMSRALTDPRIQGKRHGTILRASAARYNDDEVVFAVVTYAERSYSTAFLHLVQYAMVPGFLTGAHIYRMECEYGNPLDGKKAYNHYRDALYAAFPEHHTESTI